MTYPIISVSHSSQVEYLGSKQKFWFDFPTENQDQNILRLCKIGRGIGESWAEKLTYEIAKLLGLPCASYELASYEDETGKFFNAIVTPSFTSQNDILVHGNEVLSETFKHYPKEKGFEEKAYEINTVLELLKTHSSVVLPPLGWERSPSGKPQTILELFIAYLMFDCIVGNQDRHDQNWGYIFSVDNKGVRAIHFAPTFDHASSLACRLSDEEKEARLTTKDKGYSVQYFATKARTPFFLSNKRLSTFDCLITALSFSSTNKDIGDEWINKLSLINKDALNHIFEQFPHDYISPISIDFTRELILSNTHRIQQYKKLRTP